MMCKFSWNLFLCNSLK